MYNMNNCPDMQPRKGSGRNIRHPFVQGSTFDSPFAPKPNCTRSQTNTRFRQQCFSPHFMFQSPDADTPTHSPVMPRPVRPSYGYRNSNFSAGNVARPRYNHNIQARFNPYSKPPQLSQGFSRRRDGLDSTRSENDRQKAFDECKDANYINKYIIPEMTSNPWKELEEKFLKEEKTSLTHK